MTKLEQLKVAYEAATPGEWRPLLEGSEVPQEYVALIGDCGACGVSTELPLGDQCNSDSAFIALAHNMMPTLLEAIDLLETVSSARACQDHEFDVDAWFVQVRALLEKLK